MEDPHSPENLSEVQEQLWQTMLQFGNLAASQERNRIARDIHDSLGHSLTALNIQLQTAAKLWQLDPDRAAEFLAEAHRLGSTAVKEVRQTVKTLRTDCPEEQSLDSLIADLVESFYRTTNILPVTQINLNISLPGEIITPLYRIIQEALNNICKYAQATVVNIVLETSSTSLCLVIQDNGRGFNYDQVQKGFGLLGIQERVGLLRGQLQINTAPGEGCRIQADIPLKLNTLRDAPSKPSLSTFVPALSLDLAPIVEASNRSSIESLTTESLATDNIAEHNNIAEIEIEQVTPQQVTPLVLSTDQADRIERILLDLIGPIASVLLQTTMAQVQDYPTLIEQLGLNLNPGQRQQFLQRLNWTPQPSKQPTPTSTLTSTSASVLIPTVDPATQCGAAINQQDIQHCIQELTQVIGPIAQFLVQSALDQSPQMNWDELVANLVEKIPDRKKAQQFQQRLLTDSPTSIS